MPGRRPLPASAGREIGFLERLHSWYSWSFQVMERTMTRKAFGLAGIAAALLAAPAFAHHSFAMFDQSKVLYMSGTVKQFELVNPHTWLQLAVVNDKGEVSTWSFEARFGPAIGDARLVEGQLQNRRQGRGRLPPDEGRFARRSAHERQARERAEVVLQPWLRRRKRHRSCPLLRQRAGGLRGPRPTAAPFSRNGRPAGSGWSGRSARGWSCPCRRAREARWRRQYKAGPCCNRASCAPGSHPCDRPRA